MSEKKDDERERLEINLLVEGVYQNYGCDFRDYAYASLRRRVWNVVRTENLNTVTGLLERILHDPACMERFLAQLEGRLAAAYPPDTHGTTLFPFRRIFIVAQR